MQPTMTAMMSMHVLIRHCYLSAFWVCSPPGSTPMCTSEHACWQLLAITEARFAGSFSLVAQT